ncbi:hypothetical protein BDW02DRAFT_631129 [Decorospora gaudefroyi]|uniref:Uncharacterized protein n=1 Tax=Decorospora gaudefroyi TaxID=184978 RepID=A0A6A5KBJ8_9PLEO|nr:hypothetical protein BDW02DRAFT_631129 [Decorospora gaudefroyi]
MLTPTASTSLLPHFSCHNYLKNHTEYFQGILDFINKSDQDRVNECDNILQVAYTLACMEYEQHGSHFDAERSTRSIRRFAQLLRQNAGTFDVLNKSLNKYQQRQGIKRLAITRRSPQWGLAGRDIKMNLDFLVPETNDTDIMADLEAEAEPQPKSKQGRKTRPRKKPLRKPVPFVPESKDDDTNLSPHVSVQTIAAHHKTRIEHHLDSLLSRRIQSPGWVRLDLNDT